MNEVKLYPPVSPLTDEQIALADRELALPSIVALVQEVVRARTKFPGNRFLFTALGEEFGELAQAILQKEGPERVREEALQVACVAMRIYEEGDSAYDSLTDEEAKP